MKRPTRLFAGLGVVLLAAGSVVLVRVLTRPADSTVSIGGQVEPGTSAGTGTYVYRRLTEPDRTEVHTRDGKLLAVLTDGARTVHLEGPRRTFAEPKFTDAKVNTTAYARLAPKPLTATSVTEAWFEPWLGKALADRSPDVLAIAMEYTNGAKVERNGKNLQIAGDASFGPLSKIDPDGRAENSDFYDYLGVSWDFPDGRHEQPSVKHLHSLDCSGFLRMVYGYRLGYPMGGTNAGGGGVLPRQAYAIAQNGPGTLLMPNTGRRAAGLDRLLPGDLLFFNAGPTHRTHIEHSGLYLGVDELGHHRFISSRTHADGPTMSDVGGTSILDGSGFWATRWRTARRV